MIIKRALNLHFTDRNKESHPAASVGGKRLAGASRYRALCRITASLVLGLSLLGGLAAADAAPPAGKGLDRKAGPTVSITSPASGSTYTSAQTITISASASDNVGVTRVDFYRNGSLVKSDTTSPYSTPWSISSAYNGTHTWQAVARDAESGDLFEEGYFVIVERTKD